MAVVQAGFDVRSNSAGPVAVLCKDSFDGADLSSTNIGSTSEDSLTDGRASSMTVRPNPSEPAVAAGALPGALSYMMMVTPDGRQMWVPVTCAGGQYFIQAALSSPTANCSTEVLKARAAALKAKAAEAQAAAHRAKTAAKVARRRLHADRSRQAVERVDTHRASGSEFCSAVDHFTTFASDADESSCFEDDGMESDFE